MGALLFLAVFLASFLGGGGTGYYLQNQPNPQNPNVTPNLTPGQQTSCLPEANIIGNYQLDPGTSINIEATSDLPIPNDTVLPGYDHDGLTPNIAQTDNWTNILLWLFGGDSSNAPSDSTLDRRPKTWTLIKRAVPIPSWKTAYQSGTMVWEVPNCLWNGSTDCTNKTGIVFHEMTRIGILDTNSISNNYLKMRYQGGAEGIGDVWVATGWCGENQGRGQGGSEDAIVSQTACSDPLIRDVLFVVTYKGNGSRLGRGDGVPRNSSDPDNDPNQRENSWWRFDVYYNFGSLTPNYANLPQWMKSCGDNNNENNPNNRISLINSSKSLVAGLTNRLRKLFVFVKKQPIVEAANSFPQFISGSAIGFDPGITPEQKDAIILISYMISATSALPSPNTLLGTFGDGYQVYADSSGNFANIYLSSGSIIYKYVDVYDLQNKQNSLKLGTFLPPTSELPPLPPSFTYEWYTPACKPAIYLYPQKTTSLSIQVKPDGYLTQSIPEYQNGWENILAQPSGKIDYQNQTYPYLYYEAQVKNVEVPKEGWVVAKNNLTLFFDSLLPQLGLNKQESLDFKDYWVKKLSDQPYYFVGIINRENLDNIETINFSQKPDTFIRVRLYFEGLTKPKSVTSPLFSATPQRLGFTAVDWGGILAHGSCSESLISQ